MRSRVNSCPGVVPLLVPLLALLGATHAPCQRTYVIDYNNRPGTHFTDLASAFAAAMDGDILLLRYSFVTPVAPSTPITKGIMLAPYPSSPNANGSYGWEGASIKGTLKVAGLRAGQQFVMRGFRNDTREPLLPVLQLESCRSRVIIDNIVGWSLAVRDCVDVTVSQESFIYNSAIANSRVRMDSSRARSLDRTPAIVAVDSEILLHGSARIDGLYGQVDLQTCTITRYPGPAVHSSNSTFILAKDAVILGGGILVQVPPCTISIEELALKAISGFGGTIVQDSETLIGKVEGPFTFYTREIPSIRGYVSGPGLPENEFEFLAFGERFKPIYLFVSLPGTQTWLGLGGIGATWLDPQTTLLAATGQLDAIGEWRVRKRFPPGLPNGTPLYFQAAVLGTNGIELSPPAAFVHQWALR